jgi:tetratricopeptide (TPR) repeat protein
VIQRKFVSGKNAALLVFAVLQFQIPAFAQEVCRDPAGRFASIEGRVQIRGDNQEAWRAAKQADRLCRGDSIRVGEKSRAAVLLVNEAVLRLDQNTTMRLVNVSSNKEERSLLEMASGAIKSFIRKPRLLQVNTPYLNGSVEGTEFQVSVAENAASILVLEGRILASNDQGKVTINPGEIAEAQAGAAPTSRLLVKPRDAVQWTLFYPPIQATSGDAPTNLEALDKVAESDRDAAWHINRASLLLSVGRQDEALASIDAALKLDPKAGQAHALRSIIHTVRNERPQALAEAEKGVALTDTAATRIALSYAQQADFQLDAARDTLLVAVQKNPDDALAWARLSELWLMLGNRREATAAAEKAVELQPGLGRTQSVLGFAALAEIRTAQAQAAFEQAIALESADPLAHLGLGLARIRQGHLAEGRAGLETAVALDSNNALLRAYLGKAYFEEKRGPLDAQQLAVAKELDPLDPTAFFYDAIRLQTENRPVEALQELEASIERNDNRAVFRSRLLLDSDAAARGAGLARVYNDLGFQQLALAEGYKSVNTDPSDSSAHRFLADSYSVLPRHEVARVSELLQSQLLDPLNLAPIQPRAAESSLFLISAGGPATASANEFTSLFKRNQANGILSGMLGELGTWSGEAVVGGVYDNWSFSLGASRFKTDGFRDNNDQEDNTGNAFIQAALSPDTSLQFEYRRRETKNGDLNLLIDESFSTALRGETQSDTYRGGLRHAFSPNSILLGSVMYKIEDRSFYDEPAPGIWVEERRPDDKGLGGELQYLYRSEKYSITAGLGYFDLDQSATRTTFSPPFCLPFPPFDCFGGEITSTADLSAKHENAYLYSNIKALPSVTLTLGASWDSFDTEDPASKSQDQVNPKLGVTWQVQPGTTLRAAGFRVLKRSLITDQTLEPTQVAGFNQFYDDVASTDAWRYGLGMDQKFSQRIFGGVELSRRDLTVPLLYSDLTATPPATTINDADWQEDSARAYLFITPSDRVALSMEYQYQRLDQTFSPATGVESVNETKVHKVPLGIRFFTDSGWTLAVKGTYVSETYDSGIVGSVAEQKSDFWLADAMASYRLAKRRGFVTVGATNLFDKQFAYQQLDTANTEMQPARMVFGRVTLYFP